MRSYGEHIDENILNCFAQAEQNDREA